MGIRSFLRLRMTSGPAREFIRRVLVALLVATILLAGLQLRRWIAENTRHVRYQHDLVNGFYWGQRGPGRGTPLVARRSFRQFMDSILARLFRAIRPSRR